MTDNSSTAGATWFPVITDSSELLMGKRIHRSNENVCFKATWKKHPEAGDLVVKKLLINRAESLNLFEREVAVLSREKLKGHIVMPMAITRARPHYSIVLPYMENGSLEHVLHERGLPTGFPLALCLAIDAAEALVAVHDADLIHRDIKAANLLVRRVFLPPCCARI
jgi:serine/threonine protein kinase